MKPLSIFLSFKLFQLNVIIQLKHFHFVGICEDIYNSATTSQSAILFTKLQRLELNCLINPNHQQKLGYFNLPTAKVNLMQSRNGREGKISSNPHLVQQFLAKATYVLTK